MTKYSLLTLIILFIVGCDPSSVMDVDIKNSSSQNFSLILASSSSVTTSDTLYIKSNTTERLWEGFSTTGSFLEPSFEEYDSVYVENESGQILKVYTSNSEGKNIYDIETYWKPSEPSKRVYKYLYEISDKDLE